MVVYFIIVIMLCISAAIIFKCTNISNTFKTKYPSVDCTAMKHDYGIMDNSEATPENLERWTFDAMKEFMTN